MARATTVKLLGVPSNATVAIRANPGWKADFITAIRPAAHPTIEAVLGLGGAGRVRAAPDWACILHINETDAPAMGEDDFNIADGSGTQVAAFRIRLPVGGAQC